MLTSCPVDRAEIRVKVKSRSCFWARSRLIGNSRISGSGQSSCTMSLEKAQAIADEAECHAVFLDALSDGGKDALERRQACYNSFGFQGFASSSARLFMTMKQVRAIVETATGGQDISTERVSTPAPPVNSFVFFLASIHLAQFMNRRHRDRNSPDLPWRSDRWITRVSGSGLSCR